MSTVHTNNKGELETLEGFEFIRGENEYMGQAKDDKGVVYEIYSAPCDLKNCHCWATARIKNDTLIR